MACISDGTSFSVSEASGTFTVGSTGGVHFRHITIKTREKAPYFPLTSVKSERTALCDPWQIHGKTFQHTDLLEAKVISLANNGCV
jgi:hypothetical protein